jgi:hypothetical protein
LLVVGPLHLAMDKKSKAFAFANFATYVALVVGISLE